MSPELAGAVVVIASVGTMLTMIIINIWYVKRKINILERWAEKFEEI